MRRWHCCCGGREDEAADDEVGVLLVLGEEDREERGTARWWREGVMWIWMGVRDSMLLSL